MALNGKLIGYVEINSSGKVIYDLVLLKPSNGASISPDKVHGCDLISGGRGVVGSIIMWHYTHDGKRKFSKQRVEAIDETTHKIVVKEIGGELVDEIYKAFTLTFHCEEKDGKQYVVWSMEIERPNTSVPYPTTLMDYLCGFVKELDDHSSRK